MSNEMNDLDWTSGPNMHVAMRRATAVRDAVAALLGSPCILEASAWGHGDDECVRATVRHGGVVVWALSWPAKRLHPLGRADRRDPRTEGLDALVAEVGELTGLPGAKDNLVDALVAAHDHLEGIKPSGGRSGPPAHRGSSEAEVAGQLV